MEKPRPESGIFTLVLSFYSALVGVHVAKNQSFKTQCVFSVVCAQLNKKMAVNFCVVRIGM